MQEVFRPEDQDERLWEYKLQGKSWQPIDCIRTNMQPPVLGEIQAQVMYCSGLFADNPSLNHQDPFLHPNGSQLTANEQSTMWCRGPVSRLLRQVGLTVDIFWLPLSTRDHVDSIVSSRLAGKHFRRTLEAPVQTL